MKTMYKKAAMKSVMTLTAALTLLAVSCRNDDDAPNTPPEMKGNNYKITVTIPNVEATNNNALDDYVSIIASGGTLNSMESDIWKINGVLQNGQKAVSLDEDDFEGSIKTYVIESAKPLLSLAASYQIMNNNSPISISYKIEKNGTVVVNENFTLAMDQDQHKSYSY